MYIYNTFFIHIHAYYPDKLLCNPCQKKKKYMKTRIRATEKNESLQSVPLNLNYKALDIIQIA